MDNQNLEPLLLSPSEVGMLIGCSRSKIFEMISASLLPPSYKLGRSRKFKRKDVDRWIELDMPNLDKFVAMTRGEKQ